jgi:hypothetical protein
MGQGRHSRHFWRCIILIAASIQGITPDPQDLASLTLFRLICPMPESELGSTENRESVADVCEPLRLDDGSRIRQGASKLPLPGGSPIPPCPPSFSTDRHPLASHRKEEFRLHGLIPPPRRLRC